MSENVVIGMIHLLFIIHVDGFIASIYKQNTKNYTLVVYNKLLTFSLRNFKSHIVKHAVSFKYFIIRIFYLCHRNAKKYQFSGREKYLCCQMNRIFWNFFQIYLNGSSSLISLSLRLVAYIYYCPIDRIIKPSAATLKSYFPSKINYTIRGVINCSSNYIEVIPSVYIFDSL